MKKRKLILTIALIVLGLILIVICFIGENIASYFRFQGETAFLDYTKEKSLSDIVADEEFTILLSHTDNHYENFDLEASKPVELKLIKLSYKNGEILAEDVSSQGQSNFYQEKLESNPKLEVSSLVGQSFLDTLNGSIENSKGDKIEWIKDKSKLGNLLLTKSDGTTRELLTGKGYKFTELAAWPTILNVTFLNDDLILMEVYGNLEVMKNRDLCEEETPFYKKISMISPCSFERIYFTDKPNNYALKTSKFEPQFSEIYGPEDPEKEYLIYSHLLDKNSIVIMDINSSNWSELTIGFNPIVLDFGDLESNSIEE